MQPDQLIYKAASLLDRKRDVKGAEAALRQAIQLSREQGRHVSLIEAKTFLGELLFESGRADEALQEFEDVLQLNQELVIERDLVESHLRTAREHIARAHGLE